MAQISAFLQKIQLPVMPEVAYALIRTLNQEDANITTIRQVISKDPALTATLMRMANSAIFGLSRSVDTLDNAISVVGLSQIRARALSICMAHVFEMPAGLSRLDFWRSSMVCAGYARWLAGSIPMDEQQAWLTGMMSRLGELIMAQHSPELLVQVERIPRAPGERWTRERALTGFDECQITAEMARRWDFPDALTLALDACAQPLLTAPFSRLGGVVHLATLLADTPSVTVQTLEALPADLVGALQLDLELLKTSMPDAHSLGDTSMLYV